MIYKERLLNIIQAPHVSEKTSVKLEKNNVIVVKVEKYATKTNIRDAVQMLFLVKVDKVNILVTSKKSKKSKNKIGYRSNCKKAYVFLKHGFKIDLSSSIQ